MKKIREIFRKIFLAELSCRRWCILVVSLSLGIVLGAALLAICTFFSSFSKNYALCALFSFLPIAALFLLTLLGVVLPSPFKEAVNAAALFLRFDHFAMGMFDLGAILYALSLTVFFLVLTVLRLRRRQNA